jgi:Tol biopolymer transport system component
MLRSSTLRSACLTVLASTAAAQDCPLQYVEVDPLGALVGGGSERFQLSGDGRFVVFDGQSSLIVPGDGNGKRDVFLRDLVAGTTSLVSRDSLGQQLSENSFDPCVSADGRFVAFVTLAGIDPDDQDANYDVYLRDVQAGTTEWISNPLVVSGHTGTSWEPAISGDGRYVAFSSNGTGIVAQDTNLYYDVFLRDRLLGTTTRVNVSNEGQHSNGTGSAPSLSANGRRVAWLDSATNFHPGVLGPWEYHAYLRDLDAGTTEMVDLAPSGRPGDSGITSEPTISPDGSCVAFGSSAKNLIEDLPAQGSPIGPYVRRFPGGVEAIHTDVAIPGMSPFQSGFSFSADNRYLTFSATPWGWVWGVPLTGFTQTFLYDFELERSTVLSWAGPAGLPSGASEYASISWDGRSIVFESTAKNLVPGVAAHGGDKLLLRTCDPAPGLTFCYPIKSPAGCLPVLVGSGTPSASATQGHTLVVRDAPNAQIGIYVYGTNGSGVLPWASGTLCIAPPLQRTNPLPTGGNDAPSVDCTGKLTLDFNAWIASGADPGLRTGTPVFVQAWLRDPTHPVGALLTDAAAFLVGP